MSETPKGPHMLNRTEPSIEHWQCAIEFAGFLWPYRTVRFQILLLLQKNRSNHWSLSYQDGNETLQMRGWAAGIVRDSTPYNTYNYGIIMVMHSCLMMFILIDIIWMFKYVCLMMVQNAGVKYLLGIAQTYNWLQAPHMLQRASARGGWQEIHVQIHHYIYGSFSK